MEKTISIKLSRTTMNILDYYGFDYQKNLEDMCKRVAKQLIQCEKLLNHEEYEKRIKDRLNYSKYDKEI